MDLSKLSDAELDALERGDLSALSDETLALMEASQSPALASPTADAPAATGNDQGSVMAAVRGAAAPVTYGYVPQIEGATRAATDSVLVKLGKLGIGPYKGVADSVTPDSYADAKSQAAQDAAATQAANPLASTVGTVAGTGLSMVNPLDPMSKIKGATSARAAAKGALSGAVYNPGEGEGQFTDRAINAGIGAVTGGALKYGANRQRGINEVKNSASLGKDVAQQIKAGGERITETQIRPKVKELQKILGASTQKVDINPRRLTGISSGLDRLSDKMRAKVNESGRREISPLRANRLKQVLDRRANYAKSAPFGSGAAVSGEKAKGSADILRSKLEQIDPSVSSINSKIENGIRVRDAIVGKGRTSPLSTIMAKPGTDKNSLIDAFDKLSGAGLEKRGQQIATARENLLDPRRLIRPLEAPDEMRKILSRTAIGATSTLNPAASGVQKGLFEILREEDANKTKRNK